MKIGIDAGSKFLKIAVKDDEGFVQPQIYREHAGNPEQVVNQILKDKSFNELERLVFSGSHAELLADRYENSEIIDEISSIIEILKALDNKCKLIVTVGAGSMKLIELNSMGDFSSYKENSLCAAGTGSFLDEQMNRMNFTYENLTTIPFIKDAPDIATRCAVFAKSDLIHRQQEGYTKEEMWSGLCRGVVTTMLQSVFKGDIPSEDILFCGGLFLNPIVRKWTNFLLPNACFQENGHFLSAMGSIISNENNKSKSKFTAYKNENNSHLKILESKLSSDVDFSAKTEYISNGIEVRIHSEPIDGLEASIGIDIGSTSTKLVVIDAKTKNVLIDIYGRTKGNPINATKELFDELKKILGNSKISIRSTGTTGSGRKLVGKIIGANSIINEITAHFKGAAFFDNSIETIFEIGGQDSKYIRGHNGSVVDCNMNFVCAAGTGSFIEEQAIRLGFDVREIGNIVLGLKTPHTSDRCTVFMEQDINKLLREGFSREEVIAGVIRSIGKNYLNRVVGSRPITGEKIFFQGATAKNKGLVAAFESILQKEILVSPYCHVMGSFGAAIIANDRVDLGKSGFRGLDVFEKKIDLSYQKCKKCANLCKITTARFDNGKEESWGFMCGKESFEEEKKNKTTDHFKKVSAFANGSLSNAKIYNKNNIQKRPKIGVPMVLSMLNHLPLWKTFLNELGFEVNILKKSTPELKEKGISLSKSDFCFPIKISLAYFQELSQRDDIDAIFFPATISEKRQENGMPRMLCPYVISYPSIAKEAFNFTKEIISPSIDFRLKKETIENELYKQLKKFLIKKSDIKRAYKTALESQKKYINKRYEYGQKLLQELKDTNKTAIICMGRPYNLYDKIINLGLTERLKKNNIVVFPYECLIDPEENKSMLPHMYWNYGEKILSVTKKIRNIDNIFPVYFTNFSCGPDSFILSSFEEITRGKPYLIIELDEHGSETGYLTRIEAFIDVIFEKNRKKAFPVERLNTFQSSWKMKNKKLWIPPMFEYAPTFFAAAFRAWDFDAEALPVENNDAFELGKQNTRGSECLPASTTIGVFLQKLKEINADPEKHALFMATAEGPCRFGQYSMLHRNILDKNGFNKTEIFSPTSQNAYLGMSNNLRRYLHDVMMAADILTKYVYRIRPYEINSGETDKVIKKVAKDVESIIEKRGSLVEAVDKGLKRLSRVQLDNIQKPLVGIVGEIYVRSNSFCNNNLIRFIENAGGEAWLSPMSEWVLYTAWMEKYTARLNKKNILNRFSINFRTGYMFKRLLDFERSMEKYTQDRIEPPMKRILDIGKKYVPLEFDGEVILTIGRTIAFLEDGADMVVNCAPFGCMPGNITTSIFHTIQKDFNKPIINLFYDGESDTNRIIRIYLNNISNKTLPKVSSVV